MKKGLPRVALNAGFLEILLPEREALRGAQVLQNLRILGPQRIESLAAER